MDIKQQEQFGTEQEQSEGKDGRLLEIYKLHVQSMGNAIQRQLTVNRFYQIMLFGVCVLLGRIFEREEGSVWIGFTNGISIEHSLITVLLLGTILSWRWFISIDSHLQDKSLRYEVLMELEGQLEYQFLIHEQELMNGKAEYSTYERISTRELYLPLISFLFLGGLFFNIVMRTSNKFQLLYLILVVMALLNILLSYLKFRSLSKSRKGASDGETKTKR